jgi:hypothetical protein
VKSGTGGLPVPPSAGAVYMTEVHWRNNSELVVFVGVGASTSVAQSLMDLYHVALDATNPHDGSKATVTRLTSVANIEVHWSLALPTVGGLETLYFARDYDGAAGVNALELAGYNPVTGKLFSLTGKEFSNGGASMELDTSVEKLEFRQRPGSKEIYFLGRPPDSGSTVLSMNVYKFNSMALSSAAVAVTKHAATGTAAVSIHSLVVLADGSVAYVAVAGTPSATNKETVMFWKSGAASAVAIGQYARGSLVMPGSLFAQSMIGGAGGAHGVYWVQGDLGTLAGLTTKVVTNTHAYFARTDNLLKGHPIALTGVPAPQARGFTQFLGVSATNK